MQTLGPRLMETLEAPPLSRSRIEALAIEIAAGRIIPYLGPGILDVGPRTSVPTTPEALAMALHARAPVGAALRGNMWGTAQFIEQRRHRKTLVAYMADIFKTAVEPGPLHTWLAKLNVPLVVDTWYDGALASAFRMTGRTDFVELQGITRALENRDIWTKCYTPEGTEAACDTAATARTVIYEPHGSARPASNFLVADSDYVEVLTEIDIQTPIPDVIKDRRSDRGFAFIGCRFDDQMLRTYARQIMKRSKGPRFVILDFEPTRMEEKFFADEGIEPLPSPLAEAVEVMVAT